MATEMSSLRGLATRQIIREIQSGRFQPGTIVTEVQICEIVGLNRTPVREALIELVANGVIEKVPHKGYQVREFDEKSKIDVFEIIAVLDALAARLSIEKMTDEDFMRDLETIEDLACEMSDGAETAYFSSSFGAFICLNYMAHFDHRGGNHSAGALRSACRMFSAILLQIRRKICSVQVLSC